MMGQVARELGGQAIVVVDLIPFAACPGHVVLQPSQLAEIRRSHLLLDHGFERFLDGVIPAGRKTDSSPQRVTIALGGNAAVPSLHQQLVRGVADALCRLDPARAAAVRQRAAQYQARLQVELEALQALAAPLAGRLVICGAPIRSLLEWYGLKVVAVLPRDESLSARRFTQLSALIATTQTPLIVDNLQSMGRAGSRLAERNSIAHLVLSNFPDEQGYLQQLRTHLLALRAQYGVAP
jgi:zinc transport system substrate-binding protein